MTANQKPQGPDDRFYCGTDSGYYQHRRKYNERPCWKCCDAHAAAERRRYNRNPEKGRALVAARRRRRQEASA